jgi:hypothetical protein
MSNPFDTAAVAVADERSALALFLDHYREAVKDKVVGLSEEDVRRRLVPSATTPAGLIKHLTRVEVSWFQHRLAQIPRDELPTLMWIDEPDGDFVVGENETVDSLVEGYAEQCSVSREMSARFDLDHIVPHPALGRVSHRWICLHMIEETARHAGHADILREQIDGKTGD